MLQVDIGIWVKQLRLEHRLTQEGLAYKSGVSSSVLKGIESGRENFTIETLMAIAQALDVRLNVSFEIN